MTYPRPDPSQALDEALFLETGLLEPGRGGLNPGPVARAIWSRIEEAVESCFADQPVTPPLPVLTPDMLEITPEPTELIPVRSDDPGGLAADQLAAVTAVARSWLALPVAAVEDGDSWTVCAGLPGGADWEVARAEVDGDQLALGWSGDLLGGLLATHADQHGLVIPPRVAPVQAVILTPPSVGDGILPFANEIARRMSTADVAVEIDAGADSLPTKHGRWRRRGVPLRVEIGAAEASTGEVATYFRDRPGCLRFGTMGLRARVEDYLEMMQIRLEARAEARSAAA